MQADAAPARVFIYVQHLLGIGHFRRACFLAHGLATNNFEVLLVSGGKPLSPGFEQNFELMQLPALSSADESFSKLIDETGVEADSVLKALRRDQLCRRFTDFKPDIVITETFPFGRRMMRFELMPLLESALAASPQPLIVASIRDILQPKKKIQRNQEICHLVDRFYDKVLVHGDSRISRLKDSFQLADSISSKVCYSGYISSPDRIQSIQATMPETGADEVIVSAGGGAASLGLFKAALGARAQSALKQNTWRLLVGANLIEADFQDLQNTAGDGFIVERNRSDFGDLLGRCKLSISQAGYNTMIDIMASGARALVVPFSQGDEIEQVMRAQKLQDLKRITLLPEDDLNPARLARAIDESLELDITALEFDLDGATTSANLLRSALGDKNNAAL